MSAPLEEHLNFTTAAKPKFGRTPRQKVTPDVATLDDNVEYLDRRGAGALLQREFGFCSEKILAKRSWSGTGPVSYRHGSKTLYRPADLRAWARMQVSGPITSAADFKQKKKAALAASSNTEASA